MPNTILHHTHPPLGRYASSHVQAPLFENSGSAPVLDGDSRPGAADKKLSLKPLLAYSPLQRGEVPLCSSQRRFLIISVTLHRWQHQGGCVK